MKRRSEKICGCACLVLELREPVDFVDILRDVDEGLLLWSHAEKVVDFLDLINLLKFVFPCDIVSDILSMDFETQFPIRTADGRTCDVFGDTQPSY